LVHLGIIVSLTAYPIVAPTSPWVNLPAPGRGPVAIEGGDTAAQISASRHLWEENVYTYRTHCIVEQALKKLIITVFEPMYLDILNNDMVGFVNTPSIEMCDQFLFHSYGSITAVDLEHNFKNMRKTWDPQQPVETVFKQIQDYVDCAESEGETVGPAQQISVAYTNIFATGIFMSACHRWNEK
jgi:hypothetical protein